MARGAYVARRFAEELRRHGETMTLTRPGGAAVTVKAKRLDGNKTTIVAGDRAQTFLTFKISNAEISAASWPGPPQKDDTLTDASAQKYTLESDADTRSHDGVTLAHFLLVKG